MRIFPVVANYGDMKPQFLQIGGVIIAAAHIVSVDLRKDTVATVIMTNSQSYTFEDRDGVVRFFESQGDTPAPAPPEALFVEKTPAA